MIKIVVPSSIRIINYLNNIHFKIVTFITKRTPKSKGYAQSKHFQDGPPYEVLYPEYYFCWQTDGYERLNTGVLRYDAYGGNS